MGGTAVAYLHPNVMVGIFHSCERMLFDAHPEYVRIELNSGPRIATARNELVHAFREHPNNLEWLFMVDDDMAFPAQHIERLKAVADPVERPLVGGLAFVVGRTGVMEPTIKRLNRTVGGLETVWNYPGWDDPMKGELVKCDATGAACLLIHRTVLDAIWETYKDNPHPWFADSVHGGHEFGEDVTFCVRAMQHGFPLYVDTRVEFGHVKPWVYKSDDYRRNRAEIEAMGDNEFMGYYLARTGFVETGPVTPYEPRVESVMNRAERRRMARQR